MVRNARAVRRAAVVALLIGVSACGQAYVNWSGGTRYTVTTSLMQKPGEAPRACSFIPLPLPPIGCGGASVADLDLMSLPDARRYSNGVVSVGVYQLVGVWQDGELHLTEAPSTAAGSETTPQPSCAQNPVEPSPTDEPQGQKLMHDDALLKSRGIVVISFGMCRGFLFIVVAVADPATVDFMTSRYAPAKVAGWLQPLS